MTIPIPFLVTALLGLMLVVYGAVFGKRTGKLEFYVLIIVGLGLMAISGKAWKDFKHIEQGSVYARP